MIGTEGWIRLVRENREPGIKFLDLSNNQINAFSLLRFLYENCIPQLPPTKSQEITSDDVIYENCTLQSPSTNSQEITSDESISPITLLQFISYEQLKSAPESSNSSFNRQKTSEISANNRSNLSGATSLLKEIFQKQQRKESAIEAKNKCTATQVRHSLFRLGKM